MDLALACARTLCSIVASLPAGNQAALARTAAEDLIQKARVGSEDSASGQAARMAALPASAVLASLWPGVLPSSAAGPVTQALLRVTLSSGGQTNGTASPIQTGAAVSAAAVAALHTTQYASAAAASVVNKWPAAEGDLAAAVILALEGTLLPALRAGGDGGCSPATLWACLRNVAQGLAMRGHNASGTAVAFAVETLVQGAPSNSGGAACSQAAAQVFSLVGGEGGALPLLSARSHAVVKPLWQQRFLVTSLNALLPALEASQRSQSSRLGTPSQQSHDDADMQAVFGASAGIINGSSPPAAAITDSRASSGAWDPTPALLCAVVHLVRAAPPALVRGEVPRVFPLLVRALGALRGGDFEDADALQGALNALGHMLMHDKGGQKGMVPADF